MRAGQILPNSRIVCVNQDKQDAQAHNKQLLCDSQTNLRAERILSNVQDDAIDSVNIINDARVILSGNTLRHNTELEGELAETNCTRDPECDPVDCKKY